MQAGRQAGRRSSGEGRGHGPQPQQQKEASGAGVSWSALGVTAASGRAFPAVG